MIQTRFSLLRNKFFFLLGIIIFLSIFFVAFNNFQSNETVLQQKIEKLELQNEGMQQKLEGSTIISVMELIFVYFRRFQVRKWNNIKGCQPSGSSTNAPSGN